MKIKLLLWTFVLILLFTNIAKAGNVTIFVNDTISLNLILGDSFVREDSNGNDNFGDDDDISVKANDNAARRSYIKFNLTTIQDADYIVNSTLILVEDNDNSADTMNIRLHEIYLNGTSKWCEGDGGNNNDAQLCSAIGQNGTYEATWNNQPCGTTENNIGISGNCSSNHTINRSVSNTNGNFSFDITNLTIKYLKDRIFSIVAVADNEALNPGSNEVQFESKEEIGTGLDPRLNITYLILPPNSSLNNPLNNQSFLNRSTINFTCSAIDDVNLINITLYHNINGNFASNQTLNINGLSNSSNFTINNIKSGNYIWSCLACNKYGACEFNNTNFTLNIKNVGVVNLTLNNNHENITVNISENVNISTMLLDGIGNISVYDNNDLTANGFNPSLNVSYSSNGTHQINASYIGNENYTAAYDILTITVVNNTQSNNQSGNQPQQNTDGSSPLSQPGLSPSDSGIRKVEESPGRTLAKEVPKENRQWPREVTVAEGAETPQSTPRSPITGSAVREITEGPKGLFKYLVGAFIRPLKNTGSILIFIILLMIIFYLLRKHKRKNSGSLKEWKIKHQDTYNINLKPIQIKKPGKREFIKDIKREIKYADYRELQKETIKKPIIIKKRFINMKEKERVEKPVFNPLRKINKEETSKNKILSDLKKVYKIG